MSIMKYITGKDNPNIKHISKLIKSASYRKQSKQFVIEGTRLCRDAFESKAEIVIAIFSETAIEKHNELTQEISEVCESTLILRDKLFSQISDTATPQGIMCVCKIKDSVLKIEKSGVYLALEHIQDPSNMGTILRTTEALGVKGVIATENCCDIYSPKVLRGTMGAVFRLPIMFCENMSNVVEALNKKGVSTIATIVDSNAMPITKIDSESKNLCAIIIGNEGNGLLDETIKKCKIQATIPMLGRAESLNASVATSIAIWEMLRG